MIDGIPTGIINGIGVVGLIVLFGLLLATSRLYTRGQVQEMVKGHEREVSGLEHDKNEWRTEARLKDQTIAELNQQNQAMLNAFGPTLTDFLQSLRRAGVGTRKGSDDG